jgi:hypothetical protein
LILIFAAADAYARSRGGVSYDARIQLEERSVLGRRRPRRALPAGAEPGGEEDADMDAVPEEENSPGPAPPKGSSSSPPKGPPTKESSPPKGGPVSEKPDPTPSGEGPPPPQQPKPPKDGPSSEGPPSDGSPKDGGPSDPDEPPSEGAPDSEKPDYSSGGQRPPLQERPTPKGDPPSEGPPSEESLTEDGPAADADPPSDSSSSSRSKKGKSKKGGNKGHEEEPPDNGESEPAAADDCASLLESAVQGQVEYTVEIAAASEKDAAVVADDVNDVVVSSLTKSLVSGDCQRRTRRQLQQRSRRLQKLRQRRRGVATDSTFLDFASGGSKVSGPCSSSGSSECHLVKSLVNYRVVEGEKGGAGGQVIDALSPAFDSLPSDEVKFVSARSVEADRSSVAAAEGSSSSQEASRPGVSPKTAAVVAGTLLTALLAALLYVRFHRRREHRFNQELDKAEKQVNLTDTTADESDIIYVYDDESQGYESGGDYPVGSKEKRRSLNSFRLPRRKKRTKVQYDVDATFADDDQSVEVIEKSTLKVPPVVPRNYSGTIITPPQKPSRSSRREWVSNTVDF